VEPAGLHCFEPPPTKISGANLAILYKILFYFIRATCKCGKIKKPLAGETGRLAKLNKKSYLVSTLFPAKSN